jgi:hypothetical protein
VTTLLLERSQALDEGFEHEARRRLDCATIAGRADAHGRLTLDELITSVWEGLAVRATVNCPVCDSPMAADHPEGCNVPPIGACLNCGSCLS